MNGTEPPSRLSVITPTMTSPATDRPGASHAGRAGAVRVGNPGPAGAVPARVTGRRRDGRAAPGAVRRSSRLRRDSRRLRRRGCRAGAIRSHRSRRLVRRATTSSRSPSWTVSAMSGTPEGDAVEHVALAAQGQLAVAAARRADAGHGQPEHGHERIAVARTARREAGELAVQVVVHVRGRAVPGRWRSRRRGSAGAAAAASTWKRSRNASHGSAGSSKPAAPACPPCRVKRSAQSRGPRRGRGTHRSGTMRGSSSPSSAPTTAGRPSSSTSRAATSPTIPTLHGPWTTLAAAPGDAAAIARGLGHDRPGQVASRQVRGLEGIRVEARLGRIVGQQQARGLEGLTHPAGRVEARRQGERDRVEIDRGGIDPRSLQQGGDARPRMRRSRSRPSRDRPVLADDRGDIGRPSRSSPGRPGRGPPPGRPAGPPGAAGRP